MFVGNIEYDRVVRWTRYIGGESDWKNLYTDDLGNSFFELNLQDSTTKEFIDVETIVIPLTLIEGPIGSVSTPTGSENRVICEFTVATPSFDTPEGTNFSVTWEDPDWGEIDWYEVNISRKTGDEPIEWVIPYE